jgi:membrane-associated phospholipid phosphatase
MDIKTRSVIVSLFFLSRCISQSLYTEVLPTKLSIFSDSLTSYKKNISEIPRSSWKDPINNMPGTWAGWYNREFTVNKIPLYTSIAIATAGLIATDHDSYIAVKKIYDKNYSFRKFSEYSEFMGQGWFQFGIAGVFAIHGLAADNDKSLQTASQTVEVILTCGAVIQTLKHITGRETPILATSPTGIWRFFPNQLDYIKHVPKYDAFPTGHLATATATLTVIMDNYPDQKWIPYIGYPAIGCIGLAMVGQGIHWWSDYPLGIAIGYSFAKVITGRNLKQLDNASSPVLQPEIGLAVLETSTPGIKFIWHL